MPTRAVRHPLRWTISAAVLVALIFWIDTVSPPEYAIPMLYIVPTVLFLGGALFAEPLVVAAVATILIVIGLFVSPAGGDPAIGLANRAMAIVLEWVTAGLVVVYGRSVARWTSEIQTAGDAQQASLRRLQEIQYALDQSAIVATTDQTGTITDVNDKFCEISKYLREELIGQDHRLINSKYHPKEFIRELWRTIANGQVWRGELRNQAKDGSIYWVDTTIVPFLNERGKPWQYLAIRYDITQRKLAEDRLRNEAALTQLGRMSAVVAHEVRNPLAALKGSLQILSSRLPADLPGREIIRPMLTRLEALDDTVTDILTYAKPSPPRLQVFALAPIVADVVASVRAAIPGASIESSGDAGYVRADADMTRAVLLNLLLNACQAGGTSPVEVRSSQNGTICEVAILDRGPGLPPEVREHLFEPFITTRADGTGLGLPIAHRLTTLQGGSLTLDDREGGGTQALLRLAAAEPHARTN